jgi:hypothetical protein
MFNIFFFENRAVYEILSKNLVEPEEPLMTSLWPILFASWISKATCAQAHAHAQAPGHPPPPPPRHTQVCDTYCFSTARIIRESALLLRYAIFHVLFKYYSDPNVKTNYFTIFSISGCFIVDLTESNLKSGTLFKSLQKKNMVARYVGTGKQPSEKYETRGQI